METSDTANKVIYKERRHFAYVLMEAGGRGGQVLVILWWRVDAGGKKKNAANSGNKCM
jgi:hypothetical protein